MAQVAAKTYQQTEACQYPQATDSDETDGQKDPIHPAQGVKIYLSCFKTWNTSVHD